MDFKTNNVFPRTKIGRDHQMRAAFRHGKVIDRKVDEKQGPLLRIQYLDKQGLISQWLPVKQFGSRLTSHFYVNKIGDDVCVNMLANGSEDGFIDGSFFNTGNPPPEGVDIDTRHYKSEDGTIIEYREIDSTFNLDASGAGLSKGPSQRVGAGGVVVVTAGEITLTAPIIRFNGDIQHMGNMVTSGVHTDANGIHGSMAKEDELEKLKERVLILEQKMAEIDLWSRK